MTGKLNLENRRILVTEVPEGIGYDLLQALIAKKATLIAFAKTTAQIKVFETYPTLIPILLDFTKCPEANQRILCKLPYLDHIVNFSGPLFDKVAASIPKYYRPENADKRTTKVDDIVSRLILAGSRSTRVNLNDAGASSSFTGSAASLAATQFTDALRTSFRKLFRGKSVGTELGSQSQPTNHEPAKRSSTVPLPQTSSKSEPEAPITPTRRLSLKLRLRGGSAGASLKSNDEKLRKSLSKLHKESRKSWERKTKKLKAKEVKKLNDLTRQVAKLKKEEMNSINAANSTLNAATLSRSDALSPETANKIVASRERKAEKDANRLAEKKFVERKGKLQEDLDSDMAAAVQKHYDKVVKKEIEILEKRALKQHNST